MDIGLGPLVSFRVAFEKSLKDIQAYVTTMVAGTIGGSGRAGITLTADRFAHVLEGHVAASPLSAGKSVFNAGESIGGLIRAGESVSPKAQSFGRNFERTVDAGREIGLDRSTGKATSIYTIITNAKDELVTMFPGHP
jgi:hypothetical protein